MSKNKKSDAKANHTCAKAPKAPKKSIDAGKPSAEMAIRETMTVFEKLPAFTYAFLDEDGGRWIGPGLIAPIGLSGSGKFF